MTGRHEVVFDTWEVGYVPWDDASFGYYFTELDCGEPWSATIFSGLTDGQAVALADRWNRSLDHRRLRVRLPRLKARLAPLRAALAPLRPRMAPLSASLAFWPAREA